MPHQGVLNVTTDSFSMAASFQSGESVAKANVWRPEGAQSSTWAASRPAGAENGLGEEELRRVRR